jgi:hypothetical protein
MRQRKESERMALTSPFPMQWRDTDKEEERLFGGTVTKADRVWG